MLQRANPLVTADAVEVEHQIDRLLRGIFAPDGQHRAEQRNHRQAQRGGPCRGPLSVETINPQRRMHALAVPRSIG